MPSPLSITVSTAYQPGLAVTLAKKEALPRGLQGLAGLGEVHIDGEPHAFSADTVLVLPKGVPHQIFNIGPQPLETLATFGATPVGTQDVDGAPIALPWRS